MATKKVEESIRSYLELLGQSNKPVVDRNAVSALKAEIRAEPDLLNKAKLLSELEREQAGRVPDNSGDKAVFIAEATAWAADNDITAGALQALGVPDDVLRSAGFQVESTGPGRARRSSPSSGGGSGRAPAVPLDDVVAAARKLGKRWRLTELAESLDREPATVRNYVIKLMEQGVVVDLGDDPGHNGRGRAAKLYAMKSA